MFPSVETLVIERCSSSLFSLLLASLFVSPSLDGSLVGAPRLPAALLRGGGSCGGARHVCDDASRHDQDPDADPRPPLRLQLR